MPMKLIQTIIKFIASSLNLVHRRRILKQAKSKAKTHIGRNLLTEMQTHNE